ncbi:MAG: hypothetical protein ACHQ52_05470 [Candidatus Eisenbacteria bacterium]
MTRYGCLPPVRLSLVAAILALTGCASTPMRVYVNPQADMTMYKKVAVIPFANLSGDPYAGARVTRAFTTELVMADRFQLVDPAVLMGELERVGAFPDAQGQIDAGKLRDTATRLEATAFIRGGVSEYAMRHQNTDDFPVVSFDAEMVDVATNTVIWRVSVTESGKGRVPVVGGGSGRSFGAVTQAACERAVAELRKKVL